MSIKPQDKERAPTASAQAIKTAADIPTQSILEQVKALDAKRAELLDGAKQEALDKANQAVSDLNELGFHYRLVEGDVVTTAPRTPRKGKADTTHTRQIIDKPCPICQFKTSPPHDGRSHRGQIARKPFTVEELMEKKFSKVE